MLGDLGGWRYGCILAGKGAIDRYPHCPRLLRFLQGLRHRRPVWALGGDGVQALIVPPSGSLLAFGCTRRMGFAASVGRRWWLLVPISSSGWRAPFGGRLCFALPVLARCCFVIPSLRRSRLERLKARAASLSSRSSCFHFFAIVAWRLAMCSCSSWAPSSLFLKTCGWFCFAGDGGGFARTSWPSGPTG